MAAQINIGEEYNQWHRMSRGFQYRILLVDGDQSELASTAALLSRQGHLVLTASDGFEALAMLRGAVPELVIADLKLPNMSGFELLAIIRKRFPGVGVIARSSEFSPIDLPDGVLTDRFIAKEPDSEFELLEVVRELLSELPVRSVSSKPETAPAWIPRTATGYVVITCTACLRSSSIRLRDLSFGTILKETCVHCGATIKYRIDRTAVVAGPTTAERVQMFTEAGHQTVAKSRNAIAESKKRIDESHE